jgi:chromosome segregation protein
MQLTKLEIKGFKSFGDKVTINFGEGITGIVGPNGCGKSNVVDAIRWVLGEQKISNLRSEKLENIIFNGTKKRKATQMAEVSLSFRNTKNLLPVEYNEVTITRRFYRSGDSEYLLNGVNCRLKDITNLFLDTGIASNSYAIIELGMVDDILNDKENSRRQLFEEAAGISKFKVRKKETMRRLKETDTDLERVEDLLFEIDKNMKSLERQAKQAERYFRLKEDYKLFSIALAQKSIRQKTQSLEVVSAQIQSENDRKLSLSKQVDEKEASLQQLKTDLLKREKLLSSRQKTLNEHVAKIRHYESEKKIKNERLRYLNDKSESLREQLEQDKQSNQRSEFSLKSLKQEKGIAEKLVAEVQAKLKLLGEELEEQRRKTNSLREEQDTLDKLTRHHRDDVYRLQKEIEIKEIQISSYRQELEKTSTDRHEKTANMAEFEQKIEQLEEALSQKNSLLEQLHSSEQRLMSHIESAEKTLEAIREERNQTSRKLDARQNEYSLTKSLVDNLEGFPEAIRFLKKKANWNKKAPLLSDIIGCDEKYRITIENYLEPFMNYYIVDSEEEAYQAINLLSDAAKGKAHFFILNRFEKFHPAEPHIYDNAIPATEIVEYDSKYRKLVSYMLDSVYIVPDGEANMPKHSENVFITQSGKIIKRHYSISGGSVGLFEGKRIGRAKNLEKLQTEIKKLQQKIDHIDGNMSAAVEELANLRSSTRKNDVSSLQNDINLLNQELVSFITRREQFANLLSSNTHKREDIQEQLATLQSDLERIRPEHENLQAILEEKQNNLLMVSEQYESNKSLLDLKSSGYNDENIRYHQQQNKLDSLSQEITFKETAYESSKERIEKNRLELQKNDGEISKLLDSNEIQEDELVDMYREKEAIEAGLNEAEKEYYKSRGDIDQLETDVRNLQRGREGVDALVMELQEKRNEIKIELNGLKERMSVEFGVQVADLEKEADEASAEQQQTAEMKEDELRSKVSEVRDKMERIGPINPMAMEAYQEIKERHDFIITQKQDLMAAKESLMTTIEEIDLVAKDTFLQAYDKIKANFIKVFRSLFTEEDDCDLKLSQPDNPLESSIEIIAKPKGKKPLSISQLSGGEKTLTATSLLFSIYLLKPAPFCIFDEVDAPLDDANIDKFNNIIRKFSEGSQFILVTHNKRTMSSTDIIYGITMVEQGVSRVVPVDLRELA